MLRRRRGAGLPAVAPTATGGSTSWEATELAAANVTIIGPDASQQVDAITAPGQETP